MNKRKKPLGNERFFACVKASPTGKAWMRRETDGAFSQSICASPRQRECGTERAACPGTRCVPNEFPLRETSRAPEGLLPSKRTTPQAPSGCFSVSHREIVGVQPTKKNSARRCASRTAHPLHRGAEWYVRLLHRPKRCRTAPAHVRPYLPLSSMSSRA